jgi:hypothetical protein
VIAAAEVHRARVRQAVAATELKLTEAALHRMPKALGAWAHRRCVALPCIALRPCRITTAYIELWGAFPTAAPRAVVSTVGTVCISPSLAVISLYRRHAG